MFTVQYSQFTVCFQTELKAKSDIITNLSGHCNSGILPNNSMSETSPVATLVCPTELVVSRTPGSGWSDAAPLSPPDSPGGPFSWGCSGKACRARMAIRSPICFCTSSTSVGLPWFSACSVKLQLLWMFSFPCSSAVSWACSTCSNIRIWYNYRYPFKIKIK